MGAATCRDSASLRLRAVAEATLNAVHEYAGIEDLYTLVAVQDVGKIGIEDYILRKPGPLDPDERRKMQEHPLIGVRIVEQVGLSPEVAEIIRQHHERPDGKGYPGGLGAERIVPGAKIPGVADAFDAMTSDRPYRVGMPRQRAVEILLEESGKQFDPASVEALINALGKKP